MTRVWERGLWKTLLEKQKLLVQAISPFPTIFSTHQRQKLSFLLHLICRLQVLSIWSCPKFCRVGMGWIHFVLYQTTDLPNPFCLASNLFCLTIDWIMWWYVPFLTCRKMEGSKISTHVTLRRLSKLMWVDTFLQMLLNPLQHNGGFWRINDIKHFFFFFFLFQMHFIMSFAICFNLDQSKILSSGMILS